MKTLITILAAVSALSANAQILEGRVNYETEITGYYDSEYSDTSTSISTYTVDFNERYIRTFIGMDELMTDYISVNDKTTGKTYFASLNEMEKTVHFINLDFETPEITDDYYDGEYEEEKPDLEHYHENFYLDLLQMPLNDTIVIPTDETKEILGFTCKKYIMKTQGQVITIWTTEQIKGLEQYYSLPKPITGLVMELYLKDKRESVHTIATFFSTQTTLTTKGIDFVPEGYQLDLGTIYMDVYPEEDYGVPIYFDIPDFMEAPEYVSVVNAIEKEIGKSISPSALKESGYIYFDVLVMVDEKGKITGIVPVDEYSDPSVDINKLNKNVKKKCAFKQGFKLNGAPVKSSFTINYTHTSYDVYEGY